MSRFEYAQQVLAELVDELDHADRLSAEQAERIDSLEADNRRLREALTLARRLIDPRERDVLEEIDMTLDGGRRVPVGRSAQVAPPGM